MTVTYFVVFVTDFIGVDLGGCQISKGKSRRGGPVILYIFCMCKLLVL
jgi:hypothetical protein